MRGNEIIYLVSVKLRKDKLKNQIEYQRKRKVFAKELAVYSSEFYNAATAGLRPSKMFEIYTDEYKGEGKLRHGEITYRIIRTSLGKSPDRTRLTCERVSADG